MDDLDSLDNIELDLDKQTEDTGTIRYIKVFGWITFGLGIIYLLVSFIRLIMMSLMNAVTTMAQSQQGLPGFDYFNKFLMYQKAFSIAAIILAGLFIVGGIGFALRKEWGRKVYMGVCALGICYHLFSGYASLFLMSDFNFPSNSTNGPDMGAFTSGVNAVTWFFTGFIPIVYLVINIILAGRNKTRAVMK